MHHTSQRSRYFTAYTENLRRIGLIELIDEHRRQAERRAWRASLVGAPAALAEFTPAQTFAAV